MHSSLVSLVGVVVMVASSLPAHGGRIATPLLARDSSANERVLCMVANPTRGTVGPYTVRIVTNLGNPAITLSDLETPPGLSATIIGSPAAFGISNPLRCEVEGKGISKNRTPVTFCVIPENAGGCLSTVSVP